MPDFGITPSRHVDIENTTYSSSAAIPCVLHLLRTDLVDEEAGPRDKPLAWGHKATAENPES